jgi:CO dehydrogenase/acetyl-CoA synthase beta subunit
MQGYIDLTQMQGQIDLKQMQGYIHPKRGVEQRVQRYQAATLGTRCTEKEEKEERRKEGMCWQARHRHQTGNRVHQIFRLEKRAQIWLRTSRAGKEVSASFASWCAVCSLDS